VAGGWPAVVVPSPPQPPRAMVPWRRLHLYPRVESTIGPTGGGGGSLHWWGEGLSTASAYHMMYYSAVIASSIVHRQHTLDFLCGFQAVRLLDSTTLALHVSNVGILRVGSWMILWPNPCLQASGLRPLGPYMY
jgi:hypothetical protein